MKKLILVTFIYYIFGISLQANNKIYFGAEVSQNDFSTDVVVVSGAKLDTEDTGFALTAGYEIHEKFDLEASYKNFGKASLSGNNGDTFKIDDITYTFNTTATIEQEVTTLALGIKPKFNINDYLSVIGKVGFHMFTSEYKVSVGTASASIEDEDTDLYYGLGLQADYNNFILEASYSQYNVADEGEITSMSLLAGYKINF